MSGGTWNHQQEWLVVELAPDLRDDTTVDLVGNERPREMPKSRHLVADLAEALEQSINDLDWHFARDNPRDDGELHAAFLHRFAEVLARASGSAVTEDYRQEST